MKYRSLPGFVVLAVMVASISACGGSAGGDTGDIARDESTPLLDPVQDDLLQTGNSSLQDDMVLGNDEIDLAVFFLTEPDRQWSCEITSASSTRYDDIYFSRNGSADGTAVFASNGVWNWSKTVTGDEINLTAPNQASMLMSDISSSNTVLMFNTIEDTGVTQTFDCVLVFRDIDI